MRLESHGVAPLGLVLSAMLLIGCAGGPVPAGSDAAPSPTRDSPSSVPSDSTLRATLYTDSGQIDVEDFTIDTSNRKFLRQMFGYRPRNLKTMSAISLRGIYEIQILGQIPDDDFTIVFQGNERSGLRKDEMFDTRIRYPDGTVVDFYAIIARLRGYRDVQRWEQTFAGNPIGVRRIQFR